MAIAFVNRAENSVSGSAVASATTAAAVHTTGNALIVCVNVQSGTSITVTDTAGNTFVFLGMSLASTNRLRLYCAYNITGHASNQVTAALTSGTGSGFVCGVLQFSGLGAGNIAEWCGTGNGSGTTVTTDGVVQTRAAESVIVAFMEGGSSNPVTWTNGTGFTLVQFAGTTGTFFATQYRIVTAGQTVTATVSTGTWGIVAGSFSAAPSAGGGGFTPLAIGAQTGIHHS